MKFPNKLTDIMRQRKITAQDIAKQSYGNISVSNIRSFQNGTDLPKSNQVRLLNHIFGIDFDLILNPVPQRIKPTSKLGISISEFGKVEKICKPGDKVKSSKIKNSITRYHKIPKPGYFICGHCRNEKPNSDYAHPEDDEIKFMFGGKGVGVKTPDEIVSLICFDCKKILDVKPAKNASRLIKLEHAMLWAKAIIFTQAMRIAELESKK